MQNSDTSPAVGLLGCGKWGMNLVRNFAALGALRAFHDPRPGARATAAAAAPDAVACASLEELLSQEISAVVVATPAATHYEVARRCLEAGKDLFVEKPLALTYEQGAELVRLATARGRILMVGHVLEYHPAMVAMGELVSRGELGKVRYVYSNRLSLGTVRSEENILWSFAPHDIAVILRLIGAAPLEISACGGAYLQPNIPDVTVTNILFNNGVRAHIFVSWLHPFKEQRLVVVGSKKMASYDDVTKKLMLYDQRVDIVDGEPSVSKCAGVEIPFASDEPLRCECTAFLEAVKSRRPPITDGQSGLQVLQVLQQAQQSLMTNGQRVAMMNELPSLVTR